MIDRIARVAFAGLPRFALAGTVMYVVYAVVPGIPGWVVRPLGWILVGLMLLVGLPGFLGRFLGTRREGEADLSDPWSCDESHDSGDSGEGAWDGGRRGRRMKEDGP